MIIVWVSIAVVLFIGVVLLLFYMNRVEANNVRLNFQSIRQPGMSLSILVLSDLHLYGWMNRARVGSLINSINEILDKEIPDIVVITGDFLDHYSGLDILKEIIPLIKSKYGVYAVFGNHDYFQYNFTHIFVPFWSFLDRTCAKVLDLKRYLKSEGVTVLIDDMKSINIKNKIVEIYGLSYVSFFKKRFECLNIKENGNFKILLSHYPEAIGEYEGRINLMIAGHTHGGQITLFGYPLIIRSRFKKKLSSGISYHNGSAVFVSRGVGVSKYLPFRFFAPPEICMLKSEE